MNYGWDSPFNSVADKFKQGQTQKWFMESGIKYITNFCIWWSTFAIREALKSTFVAVPGEKFDWVQIQSVKFKPWPNGLASRRKSTQSFDLRSTCVSFGHPLALTCVDFGRAQIRTQVDASFSPFGHPSQVRTQVLVLQTCVDLSRLASNFQRRTSHELSSIVVLSSSVREKFVNRV